MKADRILTLDFGADGIHMAVAADPSSGTPTLLDCAYAAFDPASTLPKAVQAAMTLKQLLDEKKPGTTRAVVAVGGQAVFSRVVKLPAVGSDQVEKTIRHEAVQNIPFPIEDVIWDAYVFDPESAEPEVLLAAVKADLIDGLVHAVQVNGLVIEQITAAPAALANAVHASCGAAEPTLVVDAGSSSTNVVFMDGRRIFFRSLPIAGAETARLEQEVERSIAFYAGQQAGHAPERTVNASELPGIEPGYAVCAGLASAPAVSIDFIPPVLLQDRELQRRQPLWLAAAALLVLLLAVWIVNLDIRMRQAAAGTAIFVKESEMLEQWEDQLIPLEKQIGDLSDQAEQYINLLARRTLWRDRLTEIRSILPEGMFLLRSEPIRSLDRLAGTRITVVSYLDKEPAGQDAVKLLRDALRASSYFSEASKIFSRPSKKEFAREFVLDIYFTEEME